MMMNKQYCKVGAITPIATGKQSITFLEYEYQNLMNMASDFKNTDAKLGAFFEQQAIKFKEVLERLMH